MHIRHSVHCIMDGLIGTILTAYQEVTSCPFCPLHLVNNNSKQASKQASKKRDPPNGLKRNPSTKDMGYIYLGEAVSKAQVGKGRAPKR